MSLPPLDCHAHISVSVTDQQLADLTPALIFGMTRDLDEAFDATQRWDPNILWACGMHPARVAEGVEFDEERFRRLLRRFAIVGEVGLDRRAGNLDRQKEIFDRVLAAVCDQPVLVSIHSAGCSREVLDAVRRAGNRTGLIMHWFGGSADQVDELLDLGCYFSINTAMRPEVLDRIPLKRVLPETDFPTARKRTGKRPGDTARLEELLADRFRRDTPEIRSQLYKNLRRLSLGSGAIDRFPDGIAELLLLAA